MIDRTHPLRHAFRLRLGRSILTFPLDQVGGLEDAIVARVAVPRFTLIVVGVIAAVALAFSAIWVYGVLMFDVTSRKDKIGVRRPLRAIGSGTPLVLGNALGSGPTDYGQSPFETIHSRRSMHRWIRIAAAATTCPSRTTTYPTSGLFSSET